MKVLNSQIAASPIAQGVKRIVREFDPEAEVILYGSRARGDAQPDSDWDFLALLTHPIDSATERRLRRSIYEVEWDHGEVICAILRTKEAWRTSILRVLPFHENVEQEGLPL